MVGLNKETVKLPRHPWCTETLANLDVACARGTHYRIERV